VPLSCASGYWFSLLRMPESRERTQKVSLLVTDSHNLANDGAILDGLDHVIGDIRARDLETEKRQVTFLHTILSGEGSVCQLRRTHHGPVEFALLKIRSIARCVRNHSRKKQSPEKVHRRENRALEQESY